MINTSQRLSHLDKLYEVYHISGLDFNTLSIGFTGRTGEYATANRLPDALTPSIIARFIRMDTG